MHGNIDLEHTVVTTNDGDDAGDNDDDGDDDDIDGDAAADDGW